MLNNTIKFVDSWTPDSSGKMHEPMVTFLEDLGVKVEMRNLTQDQMRKTTSIAVGHIYFLPVILT